MKNNYISLLLVLVFYSCNDVLAKDCTGRMVNPLADVCWSCIFPISIGPSPVVKGETPDTDNPPSSVCVCPKSAPPFVRVGLTVGFWEPIRLIDVTKEPFCFVAIGGQKIDPGIELGSGADPEEEPDSNDTPATWSTHWYQYPVFNFLNLTMDNICQESSGSFDIAYISEIDPTWQDDELAFLLAPESIIFGNLIAQAACVADCLASSVSNPFNPLFWCVGCQGSMYPINGRVSAHNTTVQSSLLVASRMVYKMHRMALIPITSGESAICSPIPSPMIKKSQYRMQMTVPVAVTDPGEGCNQFGKSSVFWESYKEIPVEGEDFNYLLWRKRTCCVSY